MLEPQKYPILHSQTSSQLVIWENDIHPVAHKCIIQFSTDLTRMLKVIKQHAPLKEKWVNIQNNLTGLIKTSSKQATCEIDTLRLMIISIKILEKKTDQINYENSKSISANLRDEKHFGICLESLPPKRSSPTPVTLKYGDNWHTHSFKELFTNIADAINVPNGTYDFLRDFVKHRILIFLLW